MPIDLKMEARREIKKLKIGPGSKGKNDDNRKKLTRAIFDGKINHWQSRYASENTERITCSLIPDTKSRVKIRNFDTDFYFTQFLTGYGSFADYLKRFGKVDNDLCCDCRTQIEGSKKRPQHDLSV